MDLSGVNFLDVILYIAKFIVSVSTAAVIVINWVKKQLKTVVKEVIDESIGTNNDELNKRICDISEKLDNFINSQNIEISLVKENLMNTTQDRISQAHSYYMKKDYIDELSMFFLEKLYESYKGLNGNGHVEGLMKDLRELSKNRYKTNGEKD